MAQGPAVHHHDQTIRHLLLYILVAFWAYSLFSVVNSVTRLCPSLIQKQHREEGSTFRSASLAACVVEARTLVAVFGGPAAAMIR